MSTSAVRFIRNPKKYEKFYGLNNTLKNYEEELLNATNSTDEENLQESEYKSILQVR